VGGTRTARETTQLLMAMFGEQLEMDLEDVRVCIPWDGQSPRMLTTGYKLRRFSEAARRKRLRAEALEVRSPLQWTLFLEGNPYHGS